MRKDINNPYIPLFIVISVLLILSVGALVFKMTKVEIEKSYPTQEQTNYAKKFDNTFNPPKTQEEYNAFVFTNKYGGYSWSEQG